MVAIDFTASNGSPKMKDSLHYVDSQTGTNEYLTAISGIGTVLEFYDTDKVRHLYI